MRSSSSDVTHPPAGTRLSVGPNCFTNSGTSTGSFAINQNRSKRCKLSLRSAPQRILRKRQILAAARGTDILIMRAILHPILNAKRALHRFQVADLQLGSEGLSAAHTLRLSAFFAGALVEINAHLRRALKDVEELAERAGKAA